MMMMNDTGHMPYLPGKASPVPADTLRRAGLAGMCLHLDDCRAFAGIRLHPDFLAPTWNPAQVALHSCYHIRYTS